MINPGLTKQTKIKLLMVFFFFIFLFFLITLRLYIIQVSQTKFFKDIATKQYSTEIKIMPPRAAIYDRQGKNNPLAINKEIVSAFILPHQMSDEENTLAFLKKHFKSTYKALKNDPGKKFLWVQRNVSEKTKKFILEKNIADINFINEIHRFYPYEELAQTIGITDIDNSGIAGVELQFNKILSGEASSLKIEKDARSKRMYFTNKLLSAGHKGSSINLTIDSKLQFLVNEEIKKAVDKYEAKAGCAIIINPTNGHILSMVNYPYLNPNDESKCNQKLLKNNIVSECYEFGSVLKVFSALAALEEAVTTTDEVINCEGKIAYIDKFKVENWKHVEKLTFAEVLKYSSNVGIAKIAKRLGSKQYDHLTKIGFNQSTGIEFPGERSGFVPHPKKWSRPTPIVLSFGYETNATLMQLAKAFSLIANDGIPVKPTLLLSQQQQKNEQLYKHETVEQIKNILESIGQRYKIDGYRIMGKTGTARISEKGGYSKSRHVYSFGGIVEKDDYKRVIITFIKEPKSPYLWAAQLTGPLFKNIAEKMILYDELSSYNV
ncbi:penicillin-binding protein 2 [Candidatus Babeliales bacterium]|nr:penicillin-binding protein 2 [Candidatus Babeliales bacterium]